MIDIKSFTRSSQIIAWCSAPRNNRRDPTTHENASRYQQPASTTSINAYLQQQKQSTQLKPHNLPHRLQGLIVSQLGAK